MPGRANTRDRFSTTPESRRNPVNKLYVYAGIAASVLMIVVGIGATVVGAAGRSDVQEKIQDEKIVGTPDMNPDDTAAAIEEAGIEADVPDCTVADEEV